MTRDPWAEVRSDPRLLPEPEHVDLNAVLMATPDGWVPMGRLTVDGALKGDLSPDELVVADQVSMVNTDSMSFQVPMTREQVRDTQLVLGLVTTVIPREDLL